jgi:hypothetical protein
MSLPKKTRERWDRRLHDWASYLLAGGHSCRISSAYDPRGYVASANSHRPPGFISSGYDTNRLVGRLKSDLQRALIAWYALPGTVGSKASAIGCHVNTLTYRVDAAVDRLDYLDRCSIISAAQVVEKA